MCHTCVHRIRVINVYSTSYMVRVSTYSMGQFVDLDVGTYGTGSSIYHTVVFTVQVDFTMQIVFTSQYQLLHTLRLIL